ncbi:adenylyl-sulfate kinase [Campylobacter insulaenigrae]|uniref:adenylyl-sulfate kinase n=1 Tax=Campylobacter insulaenigrae TaxID=260714 RepID=UPI0021520584|nr:adenylyl-sulfate kinase [Campylobacter insulaenigrae]MCR6570409.1 adenylyl-sulfate kinase [Campylobacter insulaenigrae]MCR6573741.1 adenylyl-sulfate kinase [Campylobacter insulaenigrae]MCR6575450.1 adenylyl-sulfate kinase [Campylobacter insulaenigrae]MCR6579838.1 adenylyl-sulfate kinase [Campylobacter insulaenigrae]MCR6582709.1 adenylyl-sulfate kinase [Campylobacter insulaenigrae]
MKYPIIWLTGLAGSGKSTIGKALYERLKQKHKNIIYLDGDELRDLLGHYGYDKKSRIDMALKRSQFAKFLNDQEMIVVVTTISMFNEIYEYNRKNFKNYFEIYVKCEMQELIKRDQKGLYTKALNKEISDVVGVDIPFDEPRSDYVIDNSIQNDLTYKIDMIMKQIL